MRCASHTRAASHQGDYRRGWWVSITLPYVVGWARGVQGLVTNGAGLEPPCSWRPGSWLFLWPGSASQMLRGSVHRPDTHRYISAHHIWLWGRVAVWLSGSQKMMRKKAVSPKSGKTCIIKKWQKKSCIVMLFKMIHCDFLYSRWASIDERGSSEREWCVCKLC